MVHSADGKKHMKHYGDITKLSGYELPVVDCITGGSPCQDLSVAGKRAGLDGERSGLFMEQIRIVKEMREHDRSTGRTAQFIRPRYMVWENVCGSLSSPGKRNGEDHTGEDFQAVLTEIVRIVQPDVPDVPLPQRRKWPGAGSLMGYGEDGQPFSVAWRIHDAQFWGVPQRRKRIALVADFGGLSAPEICFVKKGMSGDLTQDGQEREEVAGTVREGVTEPNSFTLKIRGGREIDSLGKRAGKGALIQTEMSGTLGVSQDQTLFTSVARGEQEVFDGSRRHDYKPFGNVSGTVQAQFGTGGNNQPLVVFRKTAHPMKPNMPQGYEETNISDTLNVYDNSEARPPTLIFENNISDARYRQLGDVCSTLTSRLGTGGNNQPLCVKPTSEESEHAPGAFQDVTGTLSPGAHPGGFNGQDAYNGMLVGDKTSSSVVRRLTPTECERLQGFPDGWTDIGEWTDTKGKVHKPADSPRYKALGNSIAVGYTNRQSGFWMWLMKRISAQYERSATLGSLFDGIGGFPLAWEFYNGKGSALWASEIEEFPIAVTKRHFPEEGEEKEGK